MPFHLLLIYADLILTNLNSQPVRNAIPSVDNWILSSFRPISTCRKWVMSFRVLLIWYWARFNQFQLSGGAQWHSFRCESDTDLVSINLHFQFVRNAIPSNANLILTSFWWNVGTGLLPWHERARASMTVHECTVIDLFFCICQVHQVLQRYQQFIPIEWLT